MGNIAAKNIRNIAILGHSGSGKTAFAEACLYRAKAIPRLGNRTDGNTVMDFDPEEIRRQISINTSLASFNWNEYKVNMLDTPGDYDFLGEVVSALRVADSALITVSSRDNEISVGTEKAVAQAKKNGVPFAFFINRLDEPNANFVKVLGQLTDAFGGAVLPLMLPIMDGETMTGFVSVMEGEAFCIDVKTGEKTGTTAVPADLQDLLEEKREQLLEHVAESSEELMEKYFSGEEFTSEELRLGLIEAVRHGDVIPVFCGSVARCWAVGYALTRICELMPSPTDVGTAVATDATGNEVELALDPDGPPAAVVFKTLADPYVGRISLFRVYSGTIRAGDTLYNPQRRKDERVIGLSTMFGQKQVEVEEVCAGDIGAMTKLSETMTGDSLSTKTDALVLPGIDFPKPVLAMAILATATGDEERIVNGLRRIQDEDPTFTIENRAETRQLVISGLGEVQLDVLRAKLRTKYKVDSELAPARVPYRETIRKKVTAQGRHKKQTGGHGQFGDVIIEFEPGESEEFTFEERIFGGSVPKNFHPAVEKGLQEAVAEGVLAGYPVVNLKATLLDGSYHAVDSSEMAFKIAANLAYKAALPKADPVILEPVCSVEIGVPEAQLGDIMSDVNKRRGRIMGIEVRDGLQVVMAEVPESEMDRYATDLRSMTQGRGWYTQEFVRYEQAPQAIAEKVIAQAKAEAEANN